MKAAKIVLGLVLIVGGLLLVLRPEVVTNDPPPAVTPPEQPPVGQTPAPARVPEPTTAAAIPETLETVEDVEALIDRQAVTHSAVADGDWDDPATWGGNLPKPGARIHIPAGRVVHIRNTSETHLKAVYIDGKLIFAHDADTSLLVDTLFVNAGGRLQAGTLAQPVDADHEALISILPFLDPNESEAAREQSAQLLALGEVSLHGSPKTSLVPLTATPGIGSKTLALESAPEGWQAEDLLVVAGNRLTREEGETMELTAISGTQVSVAADITGDYEPDRDRLAFAVNLSRNVALSSAPPDGSSAIVQGAAIFMGEAVGQASLANVGIYGMGMSEGTEDGLGTDQTRPAISFLDGSGTAQLHNLALIDAPDSSLHVENSQISISNSVAYDEDGGAWLTETATPSRLLWSGQRSAPGALRTPQNKEE